MKDDPLISVPLTLPLVQHGPSSPPQFPWQVLSSSTQVGPAWWPREVPILKPQRCMCSPPHDGSCFKCQARQLAGYRPLVPLPYVLIQLVWKLFQVSKWVKHKLRNMIDQYMAEMWSPPTGLPDSASESDVPSALSWSSSAFTGHHETPMDPYEDKYSKGVILIKVWKLNKKDSPVYVGANLWMNDEKKCILIQIPDIDPFRLQSTICDMFFVNPKPFSELQAGPVSPLCILEDGHYRQLKTHSSIAWILQTFWSTDPQPQKGPVKSKFLQNNAFEPSTCNHGCTIGLQLHAKTVVV